MIATFQLAMVTWLAVAVSSAPEAADVAGSRERTTAAAVDATETHQGAGITVHGDQHDAGAPTPARERDKSRGASIPGHEAAVHGDQHEAPTPRRT